MDSIPAQSSAGIPPALRVVCAADPAVLLEIVRPDIGLAIWARDVDDAWRRDSAGLRSSSGPSEGSRGIVVSGEPFALGRQLARALPGGCPGWFERDVVRLAGLLSVLAATSELTARFGAPLPREPPDGLRLCCQYGERHGCATPRWSHPGIDGGRLPGGVADAFSVQLLKGARSPALRRHALQLCADPSGDAGPGPILLIEPDPSART